MDSTKQKLEAVLAEVSRAEKLPRLSAAVEDVDKIIELLSAARDQIASCVCPSRPLLAAPSSPGVWSCVLTSVAASDPHTTSLTMTKLQNPIKAAFDKVNDDLKADSAAHKRLGKALDKVRRAPCAPARPRRHDTVMLTRARSRPAELPAQAAAYGERHDGQPRAAH